jgi:hypothetical protein
MSVPTILPVVMQTLQAGFCTGQLSLEQCFYPLLNCAGSAGDGVAESNVDATDLAAHLLMLAKLGAQL